MDTIAAPGTLEALRFDNRYAKLGDAFSEERLPEGLPEPVLAAFARAVSAGSTPGHHPVVFGAGLAALPSTAPLGAWAYQNLAAACFAAPKLLRIGQDATRRALAAALAPVEKNIATAMKVKRDDIGWFDPLVDLASMQHEIAHERLFIS